ncbi:UV DNA damage repair endonuclease UvsE [Anaerosalibacter sp. Marseille-P3206]|uniref:UV DNA damage repair endonuclease UvsE n=1 Tax=Anaerosalibacter sp. Marseille-P3206 TaxID=1871005 RepID=UPI000986AA9F|nr:UV DNA damage repair endonuclease UvsE [Anaerosalibacter sp. Marseille-P3206]
MNIGYACLTVGVPDTDQKSCMLKNANKEKLLELISYNLNSLENIIDYNIKNKIKLFRISSDIIPFGSNPVNNLEWWDIFDSQFSRIGHKIKTSGMRVSMHPGQYTVLNSPKKEVVENAIEDLRYHTKILDTLGIGEDNKIVLHIGGVYNDKSQAIRRFISNYRELDDSVKRRLIIENDDKSYNISDVLEIGSIINVPVVFDNLHNQVNPFDKSKSDYYWIDKCKETWREKDGIQKIHYSQQNPLKKAGSHSSTIQINKFMSFYEGLERDDIDIMLEVKDKNLSAVKCINCTSSDKSIKDLEIEWSRYKYMVLENSPSDYVEIRKLLNDKDAYPATEFYNLIQNALSKEITIGNSINAALHIWGYFKKKATDREKNSFLNNIEKYEQGQTSLKTIKNNLWKIAVKYNQSYLLDSYYFI